MSDLERRIERLEQGQGDRCNRILLRVIEDGNTPRPTDRPTEEAIQGFLAETRLCESCPGRCILVWGDDDQEFTVMESVS